jgi:sugar phosphate isomerase/epimerase
MSSSRTSRRDFLGKLGVGVAAVSVAGPTQRTAVATESPRDLFFKISLAEWSLAGTIFRGELDNLDFPALAKNEFGIEAVEYVNQFFKDKATDQAYLSDLKQRTDDLGVRNVLIMIDGEGNLADPEAGVRDEAVENHKKWVDAAKFLGCHSVRVNLNGDWGEDPDPKAVAEAAVKGYGRLVEYGASVDMGVIVENHGGLSSDARWLAGVMQQVDNPAAGTLPDFGNFCIRRQRMECALEYNRYIGLQELMPYAKGVSAKAHRFDEEGNEVSTNFQRMMQIVKDAGFTGYVGIEFEGGFMGARGMEGFLNDKDGIKVTKQLLERVGASLE